MAGGEPEHFVGLPWHDYTCATGESLQRTSSGEVVKKVLYLPYRGTGDRQGTYDSKGRIRWNP